jgi:acyl carrier protein
MMSNLEAGVRELIEEITGAVPSDGLAPLDLSPDALEEIITELEERFGCKVEARDVNSQNFRSVSSIVAFIKQP